jgi:hypothetical protein
MLRAGDHSDKAAFDLQKKKKAAVRSSAKDFDESVYRSDFRGTVCQHRTRWICSRICCRRPRSRSQLENAVSRGCTTVEREQG